MTKKKDRSVPCPICQGDLGCTAPVIFNTLRPSLTWVATGGTRGARPETVRVCWECYDAVWQAWSDTIRKRRHCRKAINEIVEAKQ